MIGLWPVALVQDLQEQFGAGIRKVLDWTDRHGTVPVPFPRHASAVSASIRSTMPIRRRSSRPARHAREEAQMKPGPASPGHRHRRLEKIRQDHPGHAPRHRVLRRGLKVATVKHAHHAFQIDDAETEAPSIAAPAPHKSP